MAFGQLPVCSPVWLHNAATPTNARHRHRTRCMPFFGKYRVRCSSAVIACSASLLQSTGASGHEVALCCGKGDQREGLYFDDRATSLRTPGLTSPNVSDRKTLLLRVFAYSVITASPENAAHLPRMTNNVLVEAFSRVSTSDSRQDALEALIQTLTPYEWRFIQSLTSTRTFQFDIIGHLPVELVAQVFSYLDTSTPWRLQRVGSTHSENLWPPQQLQFPLA